MLTLPTKKTLISTILSASIAVTSMAVPAQAGDREDEIAAILFGLATLAIIGNAIEDRNDNRPRAQVTVRPPTQPRHTTTQPRRPSDGINIPRNRRVLPAHCLVQVNGNQGQVRMFGRRCLQNVYRYANRLPQRCAIFVETPRHTRYGYRPRCLRNLGFSSS